MNQILDAFRSISRDALLTLLAVLSIILIGAGYVYFYSSLIDPSLRNRDKVITQLTDARKTLADSRQVADQTPADYQRQLTNAQASLTNARNTFLIQAQASQIPDALYQQAKLAQVQIIDLQTQTIPTSTLKSAVITSTIRLQAQGDSRQLVDFVSNLKVASFKSVVINNVGITQDKGITKLSLDLTLYVSPVVPGDARTAPTPTPITTPTQVQQLSVPPPEPVIVLPTPLPTLAPPTPTIYIPPTVTPIPPTPVVPMTLYVVRPGDTLYSLARVYGVTIQAIMAANNLPTTTIFAGQTLIIPKP